MRPMPSSRFGSSDEGKIIQTKYWIDIGGYGISLEHLFLVGFLPKSVERRFEEAGVDRTRTIEELTGGKIRFRPLPGEKFEQRLDKVLSGLNLVLQIKRHVDSAIETIEKLLKEKWHDEDAQYLPDDLPENIREMLLSSREKYIISGDPDSARQLLSIIPVLKGLMHLPYTAGLFSEAKTLFDRMAMETVSMSMTNLSISGRKEEYQSLENWANAAADAIMEGELVG